MRSRWVVVAALLLPGAAMAQQNPRPPVRPPTDTGLPPFEARRQPGDTTRADTTRAKRELVQWNEPDSVMNALLARSGFTATRYQGKAATFDAANRTLKLSGDGAVQRDQTILVSDTILYNDSTKIVRAAAPPNDTIVLRDPSAGTSDLLALRGMAYDIVRHKGIASELSTSTAQAGQTWYVSTYQGAVLGDTTGRGRSTTFAMEGSITSCDLPDPHYHFEAKEIKLVTRSILVARPAVLYIEDIPVLWLPFIFQDMRTGRRSGLIPPRFGISDIVRTSPSYTREIDNLGYYFAINDYLDATVSLDWRSGNSDREGDVGWTRYNGEWRYRWLDRFLSGRIGASYSTFTDGQTSLNLAWSHQQQFSQHSSINGNFNYSSNTTAIRQQAFTAVQTLAAIASALNFQQAFGPTNLSIGGTRTQYTGRKEVDQNFPNFSLTTKPVNVTSWLLWSPQLSVNNSQSFNIDAAPFVYRPTATGFDSVQVKADTRNTTMSFQTPLRIGGFNWQNSFQVSDRENDFPQAFDVRDFNTGALLGRRVYQKSYLTSVDWQTGISLPVMLQGSFKLQPFVSIVNADPTSAFWVRSQLTGSRYVHQSKTLQYGLSAAPTIFGFFPGFGPFSRIRHSISPRLTFSYAPGAAVSDEFLQAQNKTRANYLGGLPQENVSLQLDQVIEAKLKAQNDTNPETAPKIKLLALSFSPITYDFERARKTGRTGITTTAFNYRIASDLLPGFDLGVSYSLFQGDVQSDTARFKPFRTGITASFTIGKNNNPITALSRIFGGSAAAADTAGAAAAPGGPGREQPVIAGPGLGRYPAGINTGGGWTASFQFNSTRSRPVPGARVYDPQTACRIFLSDPITYQRCLSAPPPADTLQQTVAGGQGFITPARTTLTSNVSFNLTPKWAMQWSSGYDFERHEFSDQNVQLQRDMHDWRAVMGFTRAPNGNFAFTFFIALKAEPDLKFDYSRSTYRPTGP